MKGQKYRIQIASGHSVYLSSISKVFYNEEDIPRTECQSNKDAVQAERKRVKEDTIKIVEEMKKKRTYFIGGYRDQEDAGYNQVIDDIINLLKNQ